MPQSRWRAWRREVGLAQNARPISGVMGRVHYDDTMLGGETEEWIDSYLSSGTSAIQCMEQGLAACGRSFSDVRRCLDFGCGYGRILRRLCEKLPTGRISAFDLDPVAVRFCRNEFRVRTRLSSVDLESIRLRRYDLIWVGSVFTHLTRENVDILFRKLGGALVPGGTLIFSIHGDWSVSNLAHLYNAEHADESQKIQDEYHSQGISFRPYANAVGAEPLGSYGMTWMSRSYVEERIEKLFGGELEARDFNPQGWHGHHDVFTVQRAS